MITRAIEHEILPALRALGISVTAYGVLSRGLLSERASDAALTRGRFPRFQGENLAHNLTLVEALKEIAAALPPPAHPPALPPGLAG